MGQYEEDAERYAGREDEDEEPKEVRCKYCRERDLFWQEGRGEHNRKKWLLVDGAGNIHDCPKKGSTQRNADPADDFESC